MIAETGQFDIEDTQDTTRFTLLEMSQPSRSAARCHAEAM